VNVSCHGDFSACHFGNASPALGLLFATRSLLLDYKCAHIAAMKPVPWLKAGALTEQDDDVGIAVVSDKRRISNSL
jgi:hypothetical protein